MSRQEGIVVSRLRTVSQGEENLPPLRRMLENLGIQGVFSQLDVSTLPFAGGDGTAPDPGRSVCNVHLNHTGGRIVARLVDDDQAQ